MPDVGYACQEVTVVVRRPSLAVLTGAILGVVGLVGTVAFAQTEDAPAAVGDDALLERLDELEVELPADPAPTAVSIDDSGEEGDDTWGTFEGDFTGQAAVIETLASDLTRLYVDADDADGEIAAAVAEVARGWLDLGEAYDQLAEWDGHDLQFPLDAEDDDGVATDADELYGRAEAGLRLVLGARQRHVAGYVTLRELAPAEPAAQTRLDARASDAEAFDRDLRPLVQRLLSLRTTEVLRTTDRFETDAPGTEARARAMTVTCVDREAYQEASREQVESGASDTPSAPDPATLPEGERADCPDLPGDVAPSADAVAEPDDEDDDADTEVDVDVEVEVDE